MVEIKDGREELVENTGAAEMLSVKPTNTTRSKRTKAIQEWEEATLHTVSSQSCADEVQKSLKLSRKGSGWDNFDLIKIAKAGFKLKFVAPEKRGESSICEIDIEDISTEITYWKNVVICYVLGAHPSFTVMNGYIQRLWGKHGINKISMLKNDIILVRFDSEIRKEKVLQVGYTTLTTSPLLLKFGN